MVNLHNHLKYIKGEHHYDARLFIYPQNVLLFYFYHRFIRKAHQAKASHRLNADLSDFLSGHRTHVTLLLKVCPNLIEIIEIIEILRLFGKIKVLRECAFISIISIISIKNMHAYLRDNPCFYRTVVNETILTCPVVVQSLFSRCPVTTGQVLDK